MRFPGSTGKYKVAFKATEGDEILFWALIEAEGFIHFEETGALGLYSDKMGDRVFYLAAPGCWFSIEEITEEQRLELFGASEKGETEGQK